MADEATTKTVEPQAQTAENTVQQTAETSETTAKTFTQAELDAAIEARLARERKNSPDKDELKAFKAWRETQKTAEEKQAEAIAAVEKVKTEAEKRASEFEAKYTAMSKGVKAEAVDDVIALISFPFREATTEQS